MRFSLAQKFTRLDASLQVPDILTNTAALIK